MKVRRVEFLEIALTQSVMQEDNTVLHVPVKPWELMIMALLDSSGQGFTATELEKRLPICRTLREAEGYALLQEADWLILKERMELQKWGWSHEDIIRVRDSVRDAVQVPVEEKNAPTPTTPDK